MCFKQVNYLHLDNSESMMASIDRPTDVFEDAVCGAIEDPYNILLAEHVLHRLAIATFDLSTTNSEVRDPKCSHMTT